jgi:hypothetical protein
MRPSRVGAVGVVALVQFVLVACSGAPPAASQAIASEPPPSASPSLPNTGPSTEPSVQPSLEPSVEPSPSADPNVPQFADFSASTFSNGATITNEWLPLRPGRRWITDGVTIEEGERIPHRITFTVTNLTKVIDGVRTAVVWVEDYSDGVLVEKEIAFYAQDDAGTVWYFGEHPEEYEDGEFVAAPTWIAGLDDARPGIKMFADPATHTQTWYQGWGPRVEWSDFGRLDAGGIKDCVKAGCYENVDVFAESSDGEEGIFQLKSYAKGVGEIRVGWRGEAESKEELELKSTATLKGADLAKFDQMALALEAHAYKISPKLYGKTERMMPAG